MAHVWLTCPRDLLCNIGVSIWHEKVDVMTVLPQAIAALDGAVVQSGDRFAVRLRDPADAILAMRQLVTMLPEFEVDLMSFVASAITAEMLLDPSEPTRGAWLWLRARVASAMPDPKLGCGVVRHFGDPIALPVPREIADQQLPSTTGLVLWFIGRGPRIVVVDKSPFTVGRVADADFQIEDTTIARLHAQFERTIDGWVVRDLNSSGGIYIDEQKVHQMRELQPGMVIQFGLPHAFVVLEM